MMIVTLGKIADVSLGYKSLQNDFFYVNAATIETYGIEKRFLKPILMRRDLEPGAYLQGVSPTFWLFYCQSKPQDLRGTGALRYLDAMADRAATEKKQTGKSHTIREVLEAQGGGLWYAPKALPHKHHVWLRKAFDGVYSPFLFEAAALVDQRFNSLAPNDDACVTWEEIAAVVSSTVFAYSVEINGSSSMGAGVLEAPTTKIRSYPVLDVRNLKKSERAKLVTLARAVWEKENPVDWSQDSYAVGKKQAALDQWIIERVTDKVTTERLYSDLHEACLARVGLAKDKLKKVNKRKTDNIGNVADSIAAVIAPRVKSKSFPEQFIDGPLDVDFTVSRELIRSVQHAPLMGQWDVIFLGEGRKKILEETYAQEQAETIMRAVCWGRSTFQFSSDRDVMHSALTAFLAWATEIEQAIEQAIADSALGTGYEVQLRSEVMRRLGIHEAAALPVLPRTIDLNAG
jgi:hypothetical protein